MARQLRLEYPGAFYHVMNRGAGRKRIYHDEAFYDLFLELLQEIKEEYGVRIHAYCLMSNHYHLLLETPRGNLSRAMRHLNGVYTLRHNRMLKRDGPLFRGRYKAILVDAENYLLHVSRYIHLNPVEANIAKRPEAYPWSSFKHYCVQEKSIAWLTCDDIFNRFNVKNKLAAYQAFVSEGVDEKTHKIYSSAKMASIYGEDKFSNQIKNQLKIKPHPEIPQSKRYDDQVLSKEQVVTNLAKHFRCKQDDIISGNNRLLKKIAVYFCQRLTNDTQKEIGQYFLGLSYSGVSQICKRINHEIDSNKKLRRKIEELEIILSNVKT